MNPLKYGVLLGLIGLWSAPLCAAVNCNITATGVAFGVYDPLGGADLDSNGSVTLTCTNSGLAQPARTVNYTISLSTGNSGSFSARRLLSGSGTLAYNLYTDTSRTTIWGNGSGGSVTQGGSFSLPGTLLGSTTDSQKFQIYGRVPGGQNVAAGTYSDSIMVTVNY